MWIKIKAFKNFFSVHTYLIHSHDYRLTYNNDNDLERQQ